MSEPAGLLRRHGRAREATSAADVHDADARVAEVETVTVTPMRTVSRSATWSRRCRRYDKVALSED